MVPRLRPCVFDTIQALQLDHLEEMVRSSLVLALMLGLALAGALESSVRAENMPAAPAGAAAGDPAAGDKIFTKCRACHQIGEAAHNSVGPQLNGIIGRHSGSAPGYNYSDANKNSGITWDEATFREYIKNPRAKVPGTKMIFVGIQKESDIDDLVAFLKQYDLDGQKK